MIEVFQTRFGVGPDAPENERGNCYAACVASILELPLDATPDLDDWSDDNWYGWLLWYRSRGLYPLHVVGPPTDFPGYSIGTVGSPTWEGYKHAVVCYQGEPVFDPLWSPKCSLDSYRVEQYEILVPFDPSRWFKGGEKLPERRAS